MTRPREFDADAVLDRATEVFWRQGYEGTSIADLVAATGLHRGSLYAAFGSKAGLYGEVLARYIAAVRLFRALAEEPRRPVRAVLETVLGEMVEEAAGDGGQRGCLMTNTAVELGGRRPELAEPVTKTLSALEAALARRIAIDQGLGRIAGGEPPHALARYLVSAIQGLRVMVRLRPDRTALGDVVRVTLAALDPP